MNYAFKILVLVGNNENDVFEKKLDLLDLASDCFDTIPYALFPINVLPERIRYNARNLSKNDICVYALSIRWQGRFLEANTDYNRRILEMITIPR